MADKYDDLNRQIEELVQKQSVLLDAYSRLLLGTVQEAGKKYNSAIDASTQKQREAFEKTSQAINRNWGIVFNRVSQGFQDVLRNMTRMAGTGGFGQIGVEVGKKIGGALGDSLGKKMGGHAAMFGRMVGASMGTGIVTALQTAEGIRMMGAKFAPVVTAGQGGRTDYTTMGGEVIRRSNEIRQGTGAAREEILGLASELSKLGIPFDQTGMKATQYAIAAERVLNLEKGLVTSLDETAIARYGDTWESVANIVGDIATATKQWHDIALQTGSSTAAALASNQLLVKMYQQVVQGLSSTSLDMKGLGEVVLASTGTMGAMGLRPGMMTQITREFTEKMAPKTTGFMNMVSQGFFIQDLLNRTNQGKQILNVARGTAEQMQLDPNLINIPLTQMLSTNKEMTGGMFRSMLEGIGKMRDSMPGRNLAEKNTQGLFRLEGTFGLSPMTGHVLLTMADQYQGLLEQGKSPEEAWGILGKSKEVQAAAGEAGMGGMGPEKIMQLATGLGESSLSTQEKLSIAAENLAVWQTDYFKNLETKGKSLYEEAAKFISPREASAAVPPAGAAMMPPPTPTGRESFQSMPPEGPVMEATPPATRTVPMFGYSKTTAAGIEQTTTMVSEEYLNGKDLVTRIARGIASVETGGRKNPYTTMGPVITKPKSSWYGDRAYGKYQVMGGNVPKWTKEALGKSLTPDQFMADPNAQEMVMRHQIQKQLEKGRSPEDIASIHLTGKPASQSRGLRDVQTGISSEAYVKRAMKGMG